MKISADLIGSKVKVQVFPKNGDAIDTDRMVYYLGVIKHIAVVNNLVEIFFDGVLMKLSIDTDTHHVEFWPK